MLEKLEGQGHVYGLDIDSIEIEKTTQRLRNKGFDENIFTSILTNFRNIDEVSEKYGKFDLGFGIAADYDFMLRMLGKYKISTSYLPKVLYKMRVGGASNRSLKNIIQKSLEDIKALNNNNIGGIHTIILKNLSKIPQFLKKS